MFKTWTSFAGGIFFRLLQPLRWICSGSFVQFPLLIVISFVGSTFFGFTLSSYRRSTWGTGIDE